MPRTGQNFLVSLGKACSIGTDSCLCCSIGNLGRKFRLRVGEAGAEWGLEGGKGFKTITGKVLLGEVKGVTRGVWDREGVCIPDKVSSPL